MTPPKNEIDMNAWSDIKSSCKATNLSGQSVGRVGGVMTPPYGWCSIGRYVSAANDPLSGVFRPGPMRLFNAKALRDFTEGFVVVWTDIYTARKNFTRNSSEMA